MTLNEIAEAQATEVERIWPTPAGQDPVQRQVLALTEEVGEIARGVLKRSHASRTPGGVHKGKTVDEWTEDIALEIGQALGVLLGLAHQEGIDLDAVMAETIDTLRARPSILATDPRCTYTWPLPGWMGPDQDDPCRCDLPAGHDGEHSCEHTRANGRQPATNPVPVETRVEAAANGWGCG